MKNLAVFASGTGSNAVKLIEYFAKSAKAEVVLVLSNKSKAPVLEKAKELGVATQAVTNDEAADAHFLIEILKSHHIDFIVLAGYLRKVPNGVIRMFENKIVNIHPSLLPNYGGKGMYGEKVHQKVIENGEKESGITIHYVNEVYDKGKVIFQAKVKVSADDNPISLQEKVHQLEHEHFPKIVDSLLN